MDKTCEKTWEKILLKDNKDYVGRIINKDHKELDSLKKIMKYFKQDFRYDQPKDLEKRDMAHLVYSAMDWSKDKHYDAINSFWTTFACGLIVLKKNIFIKGYYFGYNYAHTEPHSKNDFAEKYLENKLNADITKIIQKFYKNYINEYTPLSHCVANFSPCPEPPFNQAKGTAKAVFCLNDKKFSVNLTNDYLTLMIELIQKATFDDEAARISFEWKGEKDEEYKKIENAKILYSYKVWDKEDEKFKTKESHITKESINAWKIWFLKNREKYFFEEYYYIIKDFKSKDKLVSIPLFKGHSLSYPIPKTENEVKECVENMVSRTKNRASKMAEELKEKDPLKCLLDTGK